MLCFCSKFDYVSDSAVCPSGSKDKATISTASFPRLSASDDQLSPASPSSIFFSTSEGSPSSPKTSASYALSEEDLRASGSPDGQERSRQANRSREQQLLHHNQKRTSSPSSHVRQAARSNSKSGSPRRVAEGWTDQVERSLSYRKSERGHSGSQEDVIKERKPHGQRDPRSSSPRKSSKKERDPAMHPGNLEEPQSPRRPTGQQPTVSTLERKDRRHKGEDATHRQERGATESGEKSWGSGERPKKGKRTEKEAAAPKSNRERMGSDADTGTMSQRSGRDRADREHRGDRHRGTAEDVSRKDSRGSSSSIQDHNCNGTSTSKKSPITPGPWKVPTSTKIQSHVDIAYADI